jgi:hypothetical protein
MFTIVNLTGKGADPLPTSQADTFFFLEGKRRLSRSPLNEQLLNRRAVTKVVAALVPTFLDTVDSYTIIGALASKSVTTHGHDPNRCVVGIVLI